MIYGMAARAPDTRERTRSDAPTIGWRAWLRVCLAAALCWVALTFAAPGRASAAQVEEDEVPDARLEGFVTKPPANEVDQRPQPIRVAFEKSGVATTWMLFLVLVVIACGAMFKNAKRSHLD